MHFQIFITTPGGRRRRVPFSDDLARRFVDRMRTCHRRGPNEGGDDREVFRRQGGSLEQNLCRGWRIIWGGCGGRICGLGDTDSVSIPASKRFQC
jgi:hypothetical protein